MPIDFHDSINHSTYATRVAEGQWLQTIERYVDIEGKYILDLGCGGGIHSKVFALSGATHVTTKKKTGTSLLKTLHVECPNCICQPRAR